MKIVLMLIAGIVYLFVLFCLLIVALIPGIGIWSNQSEIGYAIDIPDYVRAVCSVLLILLLGGGFYFLRKRMTRLV
jgi:pilus assembly protein TadC